MVLLMTVVLFATAWLQAAISNLLIDQPLVYYSVLYVVFVWCMQRARENPQDLLATLLIVSTAMIAVFSRQKGIDVTQVPLGSPKISLSLHSPLTSAISSCPAESR